MPAPLLAALGPLISRVLPLMGEAGAVGRAGSQAGRAVSEAEKIRKQVDTFSGMFKDGTKDQKGLAKDWMGKRDPMGNLNPEGGKDAGWGRGKGSDIGDHVMGRVRQQVDNAVMGRVTGQVDKAMRLLLDPVGAFAEKFEKVAQNFESAANNKFMPIVENILPAGFDRLAHATHSLIDAFINRGKELAVYSGDLSLANSMASVKSTMADIREAQEIGPGTARLTTASNDIWIEIRDMLLPIKKVVVESLATVVEGIGALIELANKMGLGKVLEQQIKTIEAIWNGATWQVQAISQLADDLKDKKEVSPRQFEYNMMNHDFGGRIIDGLHAKDNRQPQMPMGIKAID